MGWGAKLVEVIKITSRNTLVQEAFHKPCEKLLWYRGIITLQKLFYLLLGYSKTKFGQTHPILITVFFKFQHKSHQELCKNVGSQVGHAYSGVWTKNCQILLQCFNPLGHSLHTNTALNGYMEKLQLITVKMVSTN